MKTLPPDDRMSVPKGQSVNYIALQYSEFHELH